MAGQILYTQHTVAFPSLGQHGRELDDLNVQIDGKGGSIKFAWIELGGFPGGALRVESFSDSLGVLLDPRITEVLISVRRQRGGTKDIPPSRLIRLLEDQGAIPSHYHIRGLLEQPHTSTAERARLQKLHRLAKRYE